MPLLTKFTIVKQGIWQTLYNYMQVEPVRDPTLAVEWLHNGEPITHSNRIRTMFDFGFVVLELQPVQPQVGKNIWNKGKCSLITYFRNDPFLLQFQDSGVWECRARNQDGEAITKCELRISGGSGVVYDWQRPESHRGQITQLEEW